MFNIKAFQMKNIYSFLIVITLSGLIGLNASAQVKVIGAVEPNDLTDKYPTHNEIYGKGGFRSVTDLTARNAITPARRSVGMLVYVISEEKLYQLKGGLLDANWNEIAFGTGSGGSSGAVIGIDKGGTGATTAEDARVNLGLGTMAIQNKDAVEITKGAIDGTLIGKLTPAEGMFTVLDVNSELRVTGKVMVSGDITATGDVTANSDVRLKKNIVTIPAVSESLRRLHAVSYDRKDMNLHQIGFIAQNVQEYFPSLIRVDSDANKTLSLNYQTMTVPLLKGWQEHDEEISKLKSEVEQLKKVIQELKEIVTQGK